MWFSFHMGSANFPCQAKCFIGPVNAHENISTRFLIFMIVVLISGRLNICVFAAAGFIILLPSSVLSVIWITEGETPFSPVTLEPTLEYITEIGHDNRHLLKSSIIFVRLTLTSLSPIQYNEDERDLETFFPLPISLSNHFPCVCDPPDANTRSADVEMIELQTG